MSENTHASEIDRLIHSSKDVIAAARRPDGVEAEVPVSSAVKVTEGRAGAPEVRIETAWERVVPAAELGDAVTAAITSFLRERQPALEAGSHGTMDDGTVTDGDADWSVPKR